VISVNPNTMYPLLREMEGDGLVEAAGSFRPPHPALLLDHPAGKRQYKRLRAEVEPFLDSVIRSLGLIKSEVYGS
jgi:DNA-binding PadR family transcriptional regulator